MRATPLRRLVPLALGITLASAQTTVYVTDLAIFTLLAPCAADAVSYNVMKQTASACGQAAPDLQSCVCTKNNNFAAISSSISSSVSWTCGSTASEDQASAMLVYSQYCNPSTTIKLPTPTANIVTDHVTDLAAISYLAKCAQNAVSYAVMSATYDICPQPASLLAPCVCAKNQNSLRISQTINSSVRYSCMSNTADVSSAQAFFSAYCAMNAGTTSFPTPTNPPGDMTYYISALPQYKSLAPCAQSGISYGMGYLVSSLCPEGPQAVASCACIKSGVSGLMSTAITSSVKYECSSTATEDIASAMNVFSFYCSAARKEVVATGVSESIAQTYPTAKSGSGTGSGSKATNGPNGAEGQTNGGASSGSMTTIIGGAVGAIGALVIIGILAFFLWKRSKRNAKPPVTAYNMPPGSSYGLQDTGKPELDSTSVAAVSTTALAAHAAGSPRPSFSGRTDSPRIDNVSPVSGMKTPSAFGTPSPAAAELAHQNYPPMPPLPQSQQHNYPPRPTTAELQGQQGYQAPQKLPLPPELQGPPSYHQPQNQPMHSELHGHYAPAQGQYMPPELQGAQYSQPAMPMQPLHGAYGQQQVYEFPSNNQVYEAQGQNVGPPRAELQGMGWQSGPVGGYHEMDGGYSQQHQQQHQPQHQQQPYQPYHAR